MVVRCMLRSWQLRLVTLLGWGEVEEGVGGGGIFFERDLGGEMFSRRWVRVVVLWVFRVVDGESLSVCFCPLVGDVKGEVAPNRGEFWR